MKKKIFTILTVLTIVFALFTICGCKDDDGKDPEKGYELIVTGCPGNITAGSLMNISDPDTPLAVGLNKSGTFVFYIPNASGIPDSSKPFKVPGDYMIGLARVNVSTLEVLEAYLYAEGGMPTTHAFNDETVTLSFEDDFVSSPY